MHEEMMPTFPPRQIYVAADEDQTWCEQLNRHLCPLKQKNLLTTWSPQQTSPGLGGREKCRLSLDNHQLLYSFSVPILGPMIRVAIRCNKQWHPRSG
jgi:hypothetical protein